MADLLLSERTRVRLARVLDGKRCPTGVDHKTYQAIQRGDRNVVSFRNLSALAVAFGDIVLQAIPGLIR